MALATPDHPETSTTTPARVRAKPRDSFRLTTITTLIISIATLLNAAWWLFNPSHTLAPVIGAWFLLTMALGLLSVAGSARSDVPSIQWLTWLMQPLSIAIVALVNTTYSSLVGWATVGSALAATLISAGLTWGAYHTQPSKPVLDKPQTKWADFKVLMKFRIISLLLLTTLIPMYLANNGNWPSLWVVLLTMLGGTLAAGGANAINMWYDRDIDAVMSRTKKRPLPSNRLSNREVLAFGITLSVLSFIVLWFVNLLTAILAVSGIFYYVVIYTMWLKRTSVQNIVIGGGAGAIPPMVGWAAGANINLLTAEPIQWLPAVFLFAIVFYWTPPHFWALALVRRDDYARAGVPMLPVVKGEAETRRQIILYSFIMVALSLMLVSLHVVSVIYLSVALALGLLFLYYAFNMLKDHSFAATWRLYKYSLLYLALLFVAMGIDKALMK